MLDAKNITADTAGANLALALQISVLYQMFLRLSMETHSRLASAESVIDYARRFPLEENSSAADAEVNVRDLGKVELRSVMMKYRPELNYVLKNVSFSVRKISTK